MILIDRVNELGIQMDLVVEIFQSMDKRIATLESRLDSTDNFVDTLGEYTIAVDDSLENAYECIETLGGFAMSIHDYVTLMDPVLDEYLESYEGELS